MILLSTFPRDSLACVSMPTYRVWVQIKAEAEFVHFSQGCFDLDYKLKPFSLKLSFQYPVFPLSIAIFKISYSLLAFSDNLSQIL